MEIYHVDAFTSEPFHGNPAAVCFVVGTEPAEWMQNVATEMNLSETAFVWPNAGGFGLRWFTPTKEIPLCGHATLASAHALWESRRLAADRPASFSTLSGTLTARRDGSRVELDFPAIPVREVPCPEEVVSALKVSPIKCGLTPDRGQDARDCLVEVGSEEIVRHCRPNFEALRRFPAAVILTARASRPGVDIVSRYFAGFWGIDEDPVTGVAHCALATYWAPKLSKTELAAEQASPRGGKLTVRLAGDRAKLLGEAVTVFRADLSALAVSKAG